MPELKTLVEFVLDHCSYVVGTESSDVEHANTTTNPEGQETPCPLCLETPPGSKSRTVYVISDPCKHKFCADCLTNLCLHGHSRCPMCRTQ